MAEYRVVPTLWPYGGRTFTRGQIVDDSAFQRGQSASFLRLGLIALVADSGTDWSKQTKKDLLVEAATRGLDVPNRISKAELVDILAKEN